MKVTVLLRNDHDALKALFNRFTKPADGRNQNGKKELLEEIRREILIHGQMEQEIFYPALSGTASTRAAELVSMAEEEHRSIEKVLHELSAMSGPDKAFEARVSAMMNDVLAHIDKEEEEIFEEARKNISEQRLEELGLEMEQRRKIVTSIAA